MKMIDKLKEILPISLLFCFMLLFFAPFELYLSNKGYFFFPGWDMLGISCLLFAGGLVLITVILFCLATFSDIPYRFLYGCFVGGTFALYIQGNWDTTDYGAWNGADIDWSLFHMQKIIFLSVFIVLIIASGMVSLVRHDVFSRISRVASFFVLGILIVTLVVLCVTREGLSKDKEYMCTTEEELSLSSDENMLILILDAFDSGEFREIINDDNGSKYVDVLDDFTYFPDSVTGYSSTDMSIPQIITGKGYKNEELFGDYLNSAFEESLLMNWLDENDWEKNIYTDALMPQGKEGYGIANSKLLARVASDRNELMYYMYTMVAFRYMPQPIKDHFYFYADNIKGNLNSFAGEYEPYSGDNIKFYDKIDGLTCSKSSGVFQLIHIEGAHEPFTISSDLKEVDETSYKAECEASLNIVTKLIAKLKEEEVYDNTILIIMADHGYSNGRQNPLLLIKGIDERHPFIVSDKKISYYDLQDAYIELLDKKVKSEELFAGFTDYNRERFYCAVPFNTHLNFDTYSGEMKEYVCKGNAWDQSSLIATGIKYLEKDIDGLK